MYFIGIEKKNKEMLNAIKDKLKERFSYWEQEIRDEDVLDFTEYDLDEYISKSSEFKLYRYMPPEFFNIRNIPFGYVSIKFRIRKHNFHISNFAYIPFRYISIKFRKIE